MRAVVDTGVLVSGLLLPRGTIGDLLRALRDGRFIPVYSTPMMVELIEVLGRPKMQARYHIQPNDISALINLLRLRGELVVSARTIHSCRDPKDDKFLEAALAGEAEVVVTGDDDLLVLHPFEGVEILSPAAFLARL